MTRKKWIKGLLALSACLFVLWWVLGTGATLAWFSDTDTVRNQFQVGLIDLKVSYKNDIVTDYEDLDGATEAFNKYALYEPGYTQVVYLRIENDGTVDFNYKLAVNVKKVTTGESVWGNEIYLPNYLRYGVVFGKTEDEVRQQVKDRLTSKGNATNVWGPLGTWSKEAPYSFTTQEEYQYAALIVYMPEEVDNSANYRGGDQPQVDLGITVFAQQANAPMPKN